ncbi:MAG TPA: hypothetical protein VHO04_13140 [Sphingopyxis sp.]|uniref:hypothetical protein n=1 Tax=Sphingopyxis sp. TaxID=1908224 RepID=UPI002E372042|nr:hypothetical protein [Sphingopyxis sp.]HEX2813617.1 hypothetical protein [Sphingopyxis sp.]
MSANYSADGSVMQPTPRLDFIAEAVRHDLIGLYIALPGYRIARDWAEAEKGNVLVICGGANHPDQFAGAAGRLAECHGVFILEMGDPIVGWKITDLALGGSNIAVVECSAVAPEAWLSLRDGTDVVVLTADGELKGGAA